MVAPAYSMKLWPEVRSKEWQRGRKERQTSSGPNMRKTLAAARTLLTRFAWVSMTPLGSPVVPEV